MLPGATTHRLDAGGVHLALVDVEEAAQGPLATKFDESEFIETHLVGRSELQDFS
jgi:hypothetical protein